ncbi:hypothetical protein CHARACLAT_003732 [Characodon lateralis]|uniref:Uncharacterized protein n=1 Tax=Characodon lateralis TaxID=208331 RepID=A0ABU7CUI6_9TELE|nr:hypothetical protein [Characodon lateralis]
MTHCSSDFGPLLHTDLLQILQVLGRSLCNMDFQSGDWLGHSRTLRYFLQSHSVVALAVCFGSLSCRKTQPQPIFNALSEGTRLLAVLIHPSSPQYSAVILFPLQKSMVKA